MAATIKFWDPNPNDPLDNGDEYSSDGAGNNIARWSFTAGAWTFPGVPGTDLLLELDYVVEDPYDPDLVWWIYFGSTVGMDPTLVTGGFTYDTDDNTGLWGEQPPWDWAGVYRTTKSNYDSYASAFPNGMVWYGPDWAGYNVVATDQVTTVDPASDPLWPGPPPPPFPALRSLDYDSVNIVDTSVFLGYLSVLDGDRTIDVDIAYSATGGRYLNLLHYASTDGLDEVPANVQSGYDRQITTHTFALGTIEVDMASTGETSGRGGRLVRRIPYPRDLEPVGVIAVWVLASTTYIPEYHVGWGVYDPPANDQPLHAIPIGDVAGELAIPPEAWAGATLDDGERVIGRDGYSAAGVHYPHGRTVWYSWTPADDNEVLYLWGPQATTAPVVTVFTDVEQWRYLFHTMVIPDVAITIDTDPTAHPLFPVTPGGNYWYQPIPGRYDVAGMAAGDTFYIRLDIDPRNPLPLEDTRFGWFLRAEPMELYGPEDLTILTFNFFAGPANDKFFAVGGQDDSAQMAGIDASWVAVAGHLGEPIERPHPLTETTLVTQQSDFYQDDVWLGFSHGEIDEDGVLYATVETGTDNPVPGVDPARDNDIAVFERGALNPPTFGRFTAAIAAALPWGSHASTTAVHLAGNEVWATGKTASAGTRLMARMSRAGALLGTLTQPAGMFASEDAWGVQMVPFRDDPDRRSFLVRGTAGLSVWDTVTNVVTATGLPYGSVPSRWLPYDGGLVGVDTTGYVVDVTGPSWNPWDSTYRRQDWDLYADVLAEDPLSPQLDEFGQGNIAVSADGTTLYIARWWEKYPEHERNYAPGNLTGNWIVTTIYAFDLVNLTYIGVVGQYDAYPSFGPELFFQTVFPQALVGGNVYTGLREKASLVGVDARLSTPAATSLRAEPGGVHTLSDHPETVDAKMSKLPKASRTGLNARLTRYRRPT